MGLEGIKGGKIVKHIIEKTFEIALYELANGNYVVGVDVVGTVMLSSPIADLAFANFIFELRQQALEGH